METIASVMTERHRRCDELFAKAEAAASKREWGLARKLFDKFQEATESHFASEEQSLFPVFEQHMGATHGPTAVMRQEHTQMRRLFQEMDRALESEERDQFLGLSETLHIMIQQHNLKEEQILYPMTDRLLNAEREGLLEQIKHSHAGGTSAHVTAANN